MTVHIDALTFDAIIGILDFERERPQRVTIDLEAGYDYTAQSFIDYADLADLIRNKVIQSRYGLLEEALTELETLIKSAYPQITFLYLKIGKPDILSDSRVAISHRWHY